MLVGPLTSNVAEGGRLHFSAKVPCSSPRVCAWTSLHVPASGLRASKEFRAAPPQHTHTSKSQPFCRSFLHSAELLCLLLQEHRRKVTYNKSPSSESPQTGVQPMVLSLPSLRQHAAISEPPASSLQHPQPARQALSPPVLGALQPWATLC